MGEGVNDYVIPMLLIIPNLYIHISTRQLVEPGRTSALDTISHAFRSTRGRTTAPAAPRA